MPQALERRDPHSLLSVQPFRKCTGGNVTRVCLGSKFHARASRLSESGSCFSHFVLFSVSLCPLCLSSSTVFLQPLIQSVPSGLCPGLGVGVAVGVAGWRYVYALLQGSGQDRRFLTETSFSMFLAGSVYQEVGRSRPLIHRRSQTSTCPLI